MSVFVVIDYWFPSIGGGPVHVAEIVRRLLRYKDLQVAVITSNLSTGSTGNIPKEYQEIPVIRLGMRAPFGSIIGRLNFLFHTFFYLLNHDFDILHVHPYTPLLIAKLVSIVKHKPVIVTIHTLGKEVSGFPSGGVLSHVFIWLDRLVTFSIPYAAQIAVDRNLLREKCETKKRYFIPNGIDREVFDLVKKKNHRFTQLLFVGRFHPQKNLPALLYAVSELISDYPDIRLVLVGEGEEKRLLQKIIRQKHLHKVVQLLPPQFGKSLITIYKSSDLFILPSRYEGFPLTILEAWAAKLPVAATPVGMVKNLIIDGENGFIIPKSTYSDIKQTVQRIFRQKNKLVPIGKKGYDMVASGYQWQTATKKTYQVYRQVLKQWST